MPRRVLSLALLAALVLAVLTGVWAGDVVQGPWLPHQLASYAALLLACWHAWRYRRRLLRAGRA